MPLIKVAYFMLNFLNLKSFIRHLFFWVASSLSMVCQGSETAFSSKQEVIQGDYKTVVMDLYFHISRIFLGVFHGCVKSIVIQRRQHQLGRMADFPPPVTFSF